MNINFFKKMFEWQFTESLFIYTICALFNTRNEFLDFKM